MKTILKLSLFASILVLIAMSCQKTLSYEDSLGTNPGKEFNTAFVKEWYFKVFIKSVEFATNNEKINGKKQPDWRSGIYKKVGNFEIIEFPLLKEKTIIEIPSEATVSNADKKRIAAASLKRILFIKTEDNKIEIRELDYVPDWNYLKSQNYDISKVELGKQLFKFSGRITLKKWNGEILYRKLYKNGKKIGDISIRQKNSNGYLPPPSLVCAPAEVCEWVQHCTYTYEGVIWVPGLPCIEWVDQFECGIQDVCIEQQDDEGGDEEEEEVEQQQCDTGLSTSCECQLFGINCGGEGNNGGGTTGYQLNANDIRVINQLAAEDAESDNIYTNSDCQGTKRTGNINFNGTKEHWLIQLDYIAKNPIGGDREYAIPQSSALNFRGYADIVNTLTREIFEIKPNNQSGLALGITEVNRYVTKANIFCPITPGPPPPGIVWHAGINYTRTVLPSSNPNQYLVAEKIANGVIGYKYENKLNNPTPPPIVLPATVLDKLKDLVQKLKDNLANANTILAEYMYQNPDLVIFLKGAAIGAAVGIVVGTIIEDIVTLGGGIADDIACFTLAYKIVRFAWAL